MENIRITTNSHEFFFVCDTRNTTNGFAHDCSLFIYNIIDNKVMTDYIKAHCYYLNRTWESWQYQSVCIKAIDLEISDFYERTKTTFKSVHNYKKMTQKRLTEFNDELKNNTVSNTYLTDLKACKEKLLHNLY